MQKQKVYVTSTDTHLVLSIRTRLGVHEVGSIPLDGTLIDLANWMKGKPRMTLCWGPAR